LEFEIGGNKKLTKEQFEKKIQIVISKTQLFININKSQPLFGYNKTKILKLTTIKRFMGFINSLLYDWGIIIKNNRKSSSKQIAGKKMSFNIDFYELFYIDNINKYI